MATPPPALVAFRAARRLRIELARRDVNAFLELVVRDEQTGAPIRQADLHRRWHALADEHDHLVIWAAIEHGKSVTLSIGRTLWDLGRDPTLRFAIVSNTHAQAVRFVRTTARYIERSRELHEVFPSLRPASPWTESAITVARPTLSKDPSVVGYGLHGAVLGSRTDRVVLDDVLDYESTRTAEQRKITRDWVTSTLLSRTTARGRILVVGNAWHPEDLLNDLAARGWPAYRFPIERDDGTPRWPEAWPPERIAAKRRELGPIDAARSLDCVPRSSDETIISAVWVAVALTRGERATVLRHTADGLPYLADAEFPRGARVVLGVDVAFTSRATADLSALAVVLEHADRSRELLAVEAGRWHGPVLVDRIIDARRRFGAEKVVVESNGGGSVLAGWLGQHGVEVTLHATGAGKNSLQAHVERIAAEMAGARWSVPSHEGRARDRESELLVRDLLAFAPASHCPDRLAALVMASIACEQEQEVGEVGYLDLRVR
jgi:hypothetical protein